MISKDIIRTINEEISNFDYLNNDKQVSEDEKAQLLASEDFQKQFVIDSISNRNKIKENVIDSNIKEKNDNDSCNFDLEYISDINYTFDPTKEPVSFQIYMNGVNVKCLMDNQSNRSSDYDMPDETSSLISHVEWSDIAVSLYTDGGEEVPFTTFEKASPKIKGIFIKQYLYDMVANNIAQFK
jgi:hypothetical protein